MDVYENDITLCGCGCGDSVNPWLAVFRTLVSDGLSHGAVSRRFGFTREYVSVLLRRPPRFIKGHNAIAYWNTDEAREMVANAPLVGYRAHAWDGKQVITSIESLDAVVDWGDTDNAGEHLRQRSVFAATSEGPPEAIERATFWRIVGEVDPSTLSDVDLARLRQRLREAGVAPPSVRHVERIRLRQADTHSGAAVDKAHGYSKKVRGTSKTQHGRNAQPRHTRALTEAAKHEHAQFREQRKAA